VTEGQSVFDQLQAQIGTPDDLDPSVEPAPQRLTAGERARRLVDQARNKPPEEPRKRTTTRSTTPKEPPSKPGEFVEPLTQFYVMAGMTVAALDKHDQVCGPAIAESAEQCAQAWDDLAQKNPAVRRALRSMLQVSAVGAVVSAHLPIMIAILTQHMPGAVPPSMRPVEASEDDQQDSMINSDTNVRRSAA
jgi:hypothetical protein